MVRNLLAECVKSRLRAALSEHGKLRHSGVMDHVKTERSKGEHNREEMTSEES